MKNFYKKTSLILALLFTLNNQNIIFATADTQNYLEENIIQEKPESTYSETKDTVVTDLLTANLEIPIITDIKFTDFVSKKGFDNEMQDIIQKDLALTLLWSHSGADSFEVTIKEGSNVKIVNVNGTQKELRLNQYLTKPNTKYDISIKAIKSSEKSDASIVKSYTTPKGCGHNNGFIFFKQTTIPWGGINFIEGLYTVATPEQLEHITQHNATPGGSSSTFFLMNDIDFGGKSYSEPIVNAALCIKVDGQNHTIDNFTINSNNYAAGVFQQTYHSGAMKDIIVGKNATINGGSNTLYVGGLIGYSYGDLVRCKNYATINAQTANDGKFSGVGGLAGYTAFNIMDSQNYGNITNTGTAPTGGMTGLLGYYSNIARCTNTGTITAPVKGDLFGKKESR